MRPWIVIHSQRLARPLLAGLAALWLLTALSPCVMAMPCPSSAMHAPWTITAENTGAHDCDLLVAFDCQLPDLNAPTASTPELPAAALPAMVLPAIPPAVPRLQPVAAERALRSPPLPLHLRLGVLLI
jgi:hypothetical protein